MPASKGEVVNGPASQWFSSDCQYGRYRLLYRVGRTDGDLGRVDAFSIPGLGTKMAPRFFGAREAAQKVPLLPRGPAPRGPLGGMGPKGA